MEYKLSNIKMYLWRSILLMAAVLIILLAQPKTAPALEAAPDGYCTPDIMMYAFAACVGQTGQGACESAGCVWRGVTDTGGGGGGSGTVSSPSSLISGKVAAACPCGINSFTCSNGLLGWDISSNCSSRNIDNGIGAVPAVGNTTGNGNVMYTLIANTGSDVRTSMAFCIGQIPSGPVSTLDAKWDDGTVAKTINLLSGQNSTGQLDFNYSNVGDPGSILNVTGCTYTTSGISPSKVANLCPPATLTAP